jgi:hypothetical protein
MVPNLAISIESVAKFRGIGHPHEFEPMQPDNRMKGEWPLVWELPVDSLQEECHESGCAECNYHGF